MVPRRERRRRQKALVKHEIGRRIPSSVKTPREMVHRHHQRMTIRGILLLEIRKRSAQPTHAKESQWARQKWMWHRFYELMKGKIFAEQFNLNKEAYEAYEVILRDRQALRMATEKTKNNRWISIEEAQHGLALAKLYALKRAAILRRKGKTTPIDTESIEKCLENALLYTKKIKLLERIRSIGLHELPVGGMNEQISVREKGKRVNLTIEEWYNRKRILPSIERPHIQSGWFSSGLDHQIEGELSRILGAKRAQRIWEEEQDVVRNIVFG